MADDESPVPAGQVEAEVRAEVAALGELTHRMAGSLAEMAYALARRLEDPDEKSPAAVAKELRATLAELVGSAGEEGDELDDDLSAPVGPDVPAKVRHS